VPAAMNAALNATTIQPKAGKKAKRKAGRKLKLVMFDIDAIKIFRPAKPEDIKVGSLVFLVGDSNELYQLEIKEVSNPNSDYKGFVAHDGCRYGLEDLYVLKTNNDLQRREFELLKKLRQISRIAEGCESDRD
jgi:hypothetical protein